MEQVLRIPQRQRKHGLKQASERPVCRIRKGTLLGKNHRARCIMGRHSERQGCLLYLRALAEVDL